MQAHTLSGKVPRTTAPAATVQLAPIVQGPMMIAPPPIQTYSSKPKHYQYTDRMCTGDSGLTSFPISTS